MNELPELPDPAAALDALSAARSPYLIGVRHHSPALASAVPRLLDDLAPDAVLIELPSDLEHWLPWLGHPETVAPVALSVADKAGTLLSFLPFADFSPELAAIRWAFAHDVPVHAIDLPSGHHERASARAERGTIADALLRTTGIADSEELWDRLVEARSYGSAPERIRRAALAIGWAWRLDAAQTGVERSELVREAWMRKRIKEVGASRPAAVVGAFHAPALGDVGLPEKRPRSKPVPVVSSLVPYTFGLLDSRSGYPSGIRDPEWQQAVLEAAGEPDAIEHAAAHLITLLCARLREDGQVAGVPDSRAAYRIAADLAVLRGLPAPGRRELVEALRTALGQGEELGRSRAVARAAQHALVGGRQGRLAPGAPRAGLVQHVEALLAELRLPKRGDEIRLDPFTSTLDRRRHVALSRLRAARVEFAHERPLEGLAGAPALGRAWWVNWTPTTTATLELAGRYGATLPVVAEGVLRELARSEEPGALPGLLAAAAECGLVTLTVELGERLRRELVAVAGFNTLVDAYDLIERVDAGHVPGIEPGAVELAPALTALAAAAVGAVGGIAGSQDARDARSLLALVRLVQRQRDGLGEERLRWELERLQATAGPLAEAAAAAALALLGSGSAHTTAGSPDTDDTQPDTTRAQPHDQPDTDGMAATPAEANTDNAQPQGAQPQGAQPQGAQPQGAQPATGQVRALADRLVGWVDGEPGKLALRLTGALTVAAPLLEASSDLLDPLVDRVGSWSDEAFLARLPELRHGFEALSAAGRTRLLAEIGERLGGEAATPLAYPAESLALWASADLAGRAAVDALELP